MTKTIRTRRLRTPQALLVFFGMSALGAGASAVSCIGQAEAAGETLWREGTGAPVVAASANFDPRRSLAPLVKEIGPSVVNVRAHGKASRALDLQGIDPRMLPFLDLGPQQPREGIGSGVILSSDGLVVTNHHVVDNAEKLEVKLADGRLFAAKVLGTDPLTDIAVIQLQGASGLKPATLGSSSAMAVGDWVIAIGSPMGLEQSATTGIVSAKGRGSLGLYQNSYIDFLQTDASIAPGSSGGPLFNLNGEVIGINTAINAVGRGLGFAVPIDQAKQVIPQLKSTGKVVRGWLGISGRDIEPAVGATPESGALVGEVVSGTPAARAGLQNGDRIVGVDSHNVESFADLRGRVADLKPGTVANLKVVRKGKPIEVKATVGKLPSDEELARMGRGRGNGGGSQGGGLFPDGQPRLGVEAERDGDALGVRSVRPGSLAADLGLQPGDRITSVNGEPVRDPQDVARALAKDNNRVEVKVDRNGATHQSVIERR
ncbi:MAG: trypsin-like peptidase domain-containing protein [Myxococcales bacterium]|nr:trypsin-like peptidase domain-containing protein [Myxococcales bacterium]